MNWVGQRSVEKIPLSAKENIMKVIYGKSSGLLIKFFADFE